MLRLFFLLLIIYCGHVLSAQSLTLTGTAGVLKPLNDQLIISSSIGEPIAHRSDLNTQIITAGFQQTFMLHDAYVEQAKMEQAENLNITITPNPFDNQIIVSLDNDMKYLRAFLLIVDASGKLVAQSVLPGFTHTHNINLPNIASGSYFLIILDETRSIIARKTLIKQ